MYVVGLAGRLAAKIDFEKIEKNEKPRRFEFFLMFTSSTSVTSFCQKP
jgi:hypothetical protein